MKNLAERTMGELATMRDVLIVARHNIERAQHSDLKAPLLRIIAVLDSMIEVRGLALTRDEYEFIRYKSPQELADIARREAEHTRSRRAPRRKPLRGVGLETD